MNERTLSQVMRALVIATFSLALAGCAKPGPPIGYTPDPTDDSARTEDPPSGGGGFDFGWNAGKVQAKCGALHGKFVQSGRVGTCLATHPEVGATLITLVEYCDGVACRIHSVVTLEHRDAKSWLLPFEHLRRELQGRYGAPDDNDTQFPASCEQDFKSCVQSGTASATLRWRWKDGHAVLLRLGTTDQLPAAISVSYSNSNAPQPPSP